MKWRIITLCALICLVAAMCFMAGCAPPAEKEPAATPPAATDTSAENPPEENLPEETPEETPPAATETPDEQPEELQLQVLEGLMSNTIQATITMEDGGQIVLELYPDIAPQAVYNFVYLARQGFYDGVKFHRIMKGFMIQGGDPDGNGMGGPGYTIKGEFKINGFKNDLKHLRGVLSMARQGDPAYNSAGSQFFIIHEESTFLDGSYAAFGQVISGMDVVDKIADTPNSGGNGAVAPQNMPVMKTVTIDDDVELPEPDMIK